MSEPVGALIDSLGVTHEPAEGELVSDAIVVLKVIDSDGSVGLRLRYSPGMSWIERTGMLRLAEHIELNDLPGS